MEPSLKSLAQMNSGFFDGLKRGIKHNTPFLKDNKHSINDNNGRVFLVLEKNLLVIFAISILLLVFPVFILKNKANELAKAKIKENPVEFRENFVLLEENSLIAVCNYSTPQRVLRKINVIVTAYSSSPWETDRDPFITASGKTVREGIVAANFLPFGTKIRLPEVYGDKIFVVEDRMRPEKKYQVDIWFPSRTQALDFGAKRTYIEVLGS